jgi:hypothetical protein
MRQEELARVEQFQPAKVRSVRVSHEP